MAGVDIAVVGGGPGGYTAALRAARLGLRAVLVERGELGGVCGNWGCIPSKAILTSASVYDRARNGGRLGVLGDGVGLDYPRVVAHSRAAAERVAKGVGFLLRRAGVEVVHGTGAVRPDGALVVRAAEGERAIEAGAILVAVGSGERLLPGIALDPPWISTSREILEEPTLPRSLVIVGGGPIGVEFGYAMRAFGVEVTILEAQEQLLPGAEPEVARELRRSFERRGVSVRTGCALRGVARSGDGVRVDAEEGGRAVAIDAARCLVAVGRRPRGSEIGLAEAGVEFDRGFVRVDDRYRTTVPHILAVGDAIDEPPLAHVAAAAGTAAVEILAGVRAAGRIDLRLVPSCVYGHPEVASVGAMEAAARALGHDVRTAVVALRPFGRAVAGDEGEGLVKLVVDARHGEILGCSIVGAQATENIAEVALCMALEGTARELGRAVHAHPTFAEAIMECALAVLGESVMV